MAADLLASVGITKERAQAVADALGVEDCGCRGRQAKLNAIGQEWLGIGRGAQGSADGETDAETNLDQ